MLLHIITCSLISANHKNSTVACNLVCRRAASDSGILIVSSILQSFVHDQVHRKILHTLAKMFEWVSHSKMHTPLGKTPNNTSNLKSMNGSVLHAQRGHTLAGAVLVHDQVHRKILHCAEESNMNSITESERGHQEGRVEGLKFSNEKGSS